MELQPQSTVNIQISGSRNSNFFLKNPSVQYIHAAGLVTHENTKTDQSGIPTTSRNRTVSIKKEQFINQRSHHNSHEPRKKAQWSKVMALERNGSASKINYLKNPSPANRHANCDCHRNEEFTFQPNLQQNVQSTKQLTQVRLKQNIKSKKTLQVQSKRTRQQLLYLGDSNMDQIQDRINQSLENVKRRRPQLGTLPSAMNIINEKVNDPGQRMTHRLDDISQKQLKRRQQKEDRLVNIYHKGNIALVKREISLLANQVDSSRTAKDRLMAEKNQAHFSTQRGGKKKKLMPLGQIRNGEPNFPSLERESMPGHQNISNMKKIKGQHLSHIQLSRAHPNQAMATLPALAGTYSLEDIPANLNFEAGQFHINPYGRNSGLKEIPSIQLFKTQQNPSEITYSLNQGQRSRMQQYESSSRIGNSQKQKTMKIPTLHNKMNLQNMRQAEMTPDPHHFGDYFQDGMKEQMPLEMGRGVEELGGRLSPFIGAKVDSHESVRSYLQKEIALAPIPDMNASDRAVSQFNKTLMEQNQMFLADSKLSNGSVIKNPMEEEVPELRKAFSPVKMSQERINRSNNISDALPNFVKEVQEESPLPKGVHMSSKQGSRGPNKPNVRDSLDSKNRRLPQFGKQDTNKSNRGNLRASKDRNSKQLPKKTTLMNADIRKSMGTQVSPKQKVSSRGSNILNMRSSLEKSSIGMQTKFPKKQTPSLQYDSKMTQTIDNKTNNSQDLHNQIVQTSHRSGENVFNQQNKTPRQISIFDSDNEKEDVQSKLKIIERDKSDKSGYQRHSNSNTRSPSALVENEQKAQISEGSKSFPKFVKPEHHELLAQGRISEVRQDLNNDITFRSKTEHSRKDDQINSQQQPNQNLFNSEEQSMNSQSPDALFKSPQMIHAATSPGNLSQTSYNRKKMAEAIQKAKPNMVDDAHSAYNPSQNEQLTKRRAMRDASVSPARLTPQITMIDHSTQGNPQLADAANSAKTQDEGDTFESYHQVVPQMRDNAASPAQFSTEHDKKSLYQKSAQFGPNMVDKSQSAWNLSQEKSPANVPKMVNSGQNPWESKENFNKAKQQSKPIMVEAGNSPIRIQSGKSRDSAELSMQRKMAELTETEKQMKILEQEEEERLAETEKQRKILEQEEEEKQRRIREWAVREEIARQKTKKEKELSMRLSKETDSQMFQTEDHRSLKIQEEHEGIKVDNNSSSHRMEESSLESRKTKKKKKDKKEKKEKRDKKSSKESNSFESKSKKNKKKKSKKTEEEEEDENQINSKKVTTIEINEEHINKTIHRQNVHEENTESRRTSVGKHLVSNTSKEQKWMRDGREKEIPIYETSKENEDSREIESHKLIEVDGSGENTPRGETTEGNKNSHLLMLDMTLPKEKSERKQDWYDASICKLVNDLMDLPPENRFKVAKELDLAFLDPEALEIFSEQEASYNASLLRKREKHDNEAYQQNILEELFLKAKKTVEVLSDYLLLSKRKQLEDIIDMLEADKKGFGSTTSPHSHGRSIVLLHTVYSHISIETCIKLMLRVRKLYQSLFEVKKILQLVIKQEDIFKDNGLIQSCIIKYRESENEAMTVQDESVIMRGFQVLRQVSRRIKHFLNDNKIYKNFIYKEADHQLTLLNHARQLMSFLRESQPESQRRYEESGGDIEEYLLQAISGYANSEQMSAISKQSHMGAFNKQEADLSSLAHNPAKQQQEENKQPI